MCLPLSRRYNPAGNHRATLRQHGDREGQASAAYRGALQPWEVQETPDKGDGFPQRTMIFAGYCMLEHPICRHGTVRNRNTAVTHPNHRE